MAQFSFSRGRVFDVQTGEVVTADRVVRLEPQPAALLALLASRAGALVGHEELRRHLWDDGRHVDYAASIHYAVRQVRKALADGDGSAPADIETIPRRGYRLRLEAVAPDALLAAPAPPPIPWWPPRSVPRAAVAVALAAVMTGVVAYVERQPNNHHETAVAVVSALHDLIFGVAHPTGLGVRPPTMRSGA